MTSFQILSDLHAETGNEYSIKDINEIKPTTDIIVLAGDIGSFYHPESILECLRIAARKFKHVLYVPGNHEYYYPLNSNVPKANMNDLLFRFKKKVSADEELNNVEILDRRIVRINGVMFAGTTLWTDPRPLKDIPDFVRLDIDIRKYESLHTRDVRWLDRVASSLNTDEPLVVVTHHAPLKSCLKESHFIKRYSSLYTTNLERTRIFKKAKVWVFGHTHNNMDVVVGTTRVVSNQVGKEKDDCSADVEQVIRADSYEIGKAD
jgi:Icc-related predicted phosphoesterase